MATAMRLVSSSSSPSVAVDGSGSWAGSSRAFTQSPVHGITWLAIFSCASAPTRCR